MTRLHVPANTSLGSPLTGTVRSTPRFRAVRNEEPSASQAAVRRPTPVPRLEELSLLDLISLAG